MKFEDLKFSNHTSFGYDYQAKVLFPNGWGISVITGPYAYTDDNYPYELAVIRTEDKVKGIINGVDEVDEYNIEINYEYTDGDTIGFLNAEDIQGWLDKVEKLQNNSNSVSIEIKLNGIENNQLDALTNLIGEAIRSYKEKNNGDFSYNLIIY